MITDQEFVQAIKSALTRASANEIANRLRVSIPTVSRWAEGTTAPYQSIREAIVKELDKFVE
jgi:transcriptional regulator with XRE-family HTH domain